METIRGFEMGIERYTFDWGACSSRKGWAQIDTGQDASYFGTWANPEKLQIFSFVEGDTCLRKAETPDEFVTEIRGIKTWNDESGHGFKGIDTLCVDAITERFEALGLGDLLH